MDQSNNTGGNVNETLSLKELETRAGYWLLQRRKLGMEVTVRGSRILMILPSDS